MLSGGGSETREGVKAQRTMKRLIAGLQPELMQPPKLITSADWAKETLEVFPKIVNTLPPTFDIHGNLE
jgi:hypothetical protein